MAAYFFILGKVIWCLPFTSYRKLAEKYGIPKNQIAEVGKKEKWPELRVQFRDKTVTKTVEKIVEKKARQAAKVGNPAGRSGQTKYRPVTEDYPETEY